LRTAAGCFRAADKRRDKLKAAGAIMMKLGCFLEGTGHHVAAWRDPDVDPHGRQSLAHYLDIARLAERGKFDLLFMADTNATFGADDVESWTRTTAASRLEPITLLGAIAAVTERIGLVATATTTYFEPFHVARFFASLDQMSGGRAGWNLVTSLAVAEAYNFGREMHPHHGDRYARAREFAKVVLGLWDSWEDGAVIADKESGIYLDRSKLHFLNHKGKHFAVRGPLTVHRSPQGHPVIVQAGQSDDGRDLAGETAEITFTVQQDLDAARGFYTEIKRRAAAYGRPPNAIKVMPGVMTVIGTPAPRRPTNTSACRRCSRPNWRSRICRRTSASTCQLIRWTVQCPIRILASSKRGVSKSWSSWRALRT
jgi:N-acetyl-S-(2-succino)cysteine monooxygenase